MKKLTRNAKKYLQGLQMEHQHTTTDPAPAHSWAALDVGERWCGIAVWPKGGALIGAGVFRTEDTQAQVQKAIEQHNVAHLAIGVPINNTGQPSALMPLIASFQDAIGPSVQVHLVNERGSTIHRRDERTDDAAACLILRWGLRAHNRG